MKYYTAWFVLLTAGCTRHEAPVAARAQSPIPVKIEKIAATEVPDIYEATGTVRARYTAAIAAKIVGQIREIRVQTGDRVKAGQTMVIIDSRDLEANLRRALAGQAEIQNTVAESENGILAARANLDLARVTHKRYQDLLAKTSVSQQEFDESVARLKAAEASLEMALAKRKQVQARIEQAEAEVAAARIVSGYATLAAPFAGVIAERKADPGSLAGPGVPLLVLEQEGNLRLEASMDETRMKLIRLGQPVDVRLDGLGRVVKGRVAELVPSVDPATRSILVKIDLPATPGLRAGMFGRAAFVGAKKWVLLVPASAVIEHGQVVSVYVADQDTARLRVVALGNTYDARREVLAGLTAGEAVVLSPPPALSDGGRISVSGTAP